MMFMLVMVVMMMACRQISTMTKCCILFEGIALNINEISAAAALLVTMMLIMMMMLLLMMVVVVMMIMTIMTSDYSYCKIQNF